MLGRGSLLALRWLAILPLVSSAALADDFIVTASPASRTVMQGMTTNYAVTVQSVSGFIGQVSLSLMTPVGSPSFSPMVVSVPLNGTAGSTLMIMTSNLT